VEETGNEGLYLCMLFLTSSSNGNFLKPGKPPSPWCSIVYK